MRSHRSPGPSEGLRGDLVWRDPGAIKSNRGQRLVGLDCQCAAPLDDFLIVQIRFSLGSEFTGALNAICRRGDDKLVIKFENAPGRLYIRYFLRALG